MATTRPQIQYGAKGDFVTELQTALNKHGYNLSVDGEWGDKTQAAVLDFQENNKLQVDGIVGTETWGALFPEATTTAKKTTTSSNKSSNKNSNKTTTKAATPTAPKVDPFEYEAYKESEAVAQAKAALEAQLAQKPAAYQSEWTQVLKDTIEKIQNREKFSYDLNGDALYQQYKDQYTTQGKQAMMDAMGQAAALTGGYGNSYAQGVGQQTYQGYLQQLNDKVPELYQLALDQYNREGEDLYNQYALYGEQENMDYNRYRDTVSDYNAERDRLQNLYYTERDYDYSKYTDGRDFAYQGYQDKVAQAQWDAEFNEAMRQYNESFAYQKERDKVADEQWQTEFNYASSKTTGGSSSGGSDGSSDKSSSDKSSSDSGYNNGGYDTDLVEQAQKFVGAFVDGKWGTNSAAAAKDKGYGSLGAVIAAMRKANNNPDNNTSENKSWSDYDAKAHEKIVTENKGSYYASVLSDLKAMKKKGTSNKEVSTYLNDLVGNSVISQSEYLTLYNKYRDNKL